MLCNQHVWLHSSQVLANCFELAVWSVTEVQEAVFSIWQSSRMSSLVVSASSCDRRNSSEVRRVLTVFVVTVHPQTNSVLDSWWLAHGAKHHRHMANPTMDFFRTPDNGFD